MYQLLEKLKSQGVHVSLHRENELKLKFGENHPSEDLVKEIKDNKQEIIAYLKENQSSNGSKSVRIPRVPFSSSGYVLSSAQKRVWILSQMEEGSVAYNLPTYFVTEEINNIPVLQEAIQVVVDRHEILRTVFRTDQNNEPRQWPIEKEAFPIPLTLDDFSKNKDGEQRAQAMAEEDAYKPFDLEKGPLFRVKIFKLEGDKILFYYNMHHIISDGWSMEVLKSEILSKYNALLSNANGTSSALPIQYKDFASWESDNVQNGFYDKHKAYWLNQFNEDLPTFEIISAAERPQVKTTNGKKYQRFVKSKGIDRFREFLLKNGGTTFMGLMAALKILIHKYTHQNDVIVGTAISGRNHIDLKGLIGFFVNTLAIRSQIDDVQSFEDFFAVLKKNILEAYAHQSYPFDALIENLNLKRDLSRSAIFDVMLVLHQAEGNYDGFLMDENANVEQNVASMFDILFNINEFRNGLLLEVSYNSDIYGDSLIAQFVTQYVGLLDTLFGEPKQLIQDVNYLTEADENQLNEFNNVEVPISTETVISLFHNQVAKTPTEVALLCGDKSWTYQEVFERTNAIASMLTEKYKLKQGDNVGVLLPRTEDCVFAMIGVLKSGACYVPIDPEFPMSRIEHICKDSNLELIVSVKELDGITNNLSGETCYIDDETLLSFSDKTIDKSTFDSPAFIIYTSGSTGVPKGVIQTHQTLSNLIQWDINASGLTIGVRLMQYASFCFDVAVHDTFFTLSSSGSIYITQKEERVDTESLLKVIMSKSIGILSFPYSALINFFQQCDLSDLEGHSIKNIISTGEQLYVKGNLKTFLEQNESIFLHNFYGPSETHVVTAHIMSAKSGTITFRPTIGKPISNSPIYIFDNHLKPVATGVKGEVYIGGSNLAIGYRNLPELTAERFIYHPQHPEQRLYKSGDYAYWLEDGTIVYLGREDKQVKIRGYRVDLDEIAVNVLDLDEIDDAIILETKKDDESYLTAYIVGSFNVDLKKIRLELEKNLPNYMIPAFFIQIDKIPLTSNGKIKTEELPSPFDSDAVLRQEYMPPETELESKLVAIWEELLGREKIGINENFFEVGGQSIKLMNLVNLYRKAFDVQVTFSELFTITTIQHHAEVIEVKQWLNTSDNAPVESDVTITF
ncbi:MAG: amino acid adenylation domain-containing protein [Bacteroidota bacterium]